jgi:hypothetical protein
MTTTSNKLAEISPYGPTRATEGTPLSAEELQKNGRVLARLLLF